MCNVTNIVYALKFCKQTNLVLSNAVNIAKQCMVDSMRYTGTVYQLLKIESPHPQKHGLQCNSPAHLLIPAVVDLVKVCSTWSIHTQIKKKSAKPLKSKCWVIEMWRKNNLKKYNNYTLLSCIVMEIFSYHPLHGHHHKFKNNLSKETSWQKYIIW